MHSLSEKNEEIKNSTSNFNGKIFANFDGSLQRVNSFLSFTKKDFLISENGVVRNEMKKVLHPFINDSENVHLILVVSVGRRILNNMDSTEVARLIDGRRHRFYWSFIYKGKIHTKFGWHKIKKLSKNEKEFVEKNWHLNFFQQHGKFLIEQSGGVLYCENELYKNILRK